MRILGTVCFQLTFVTIGLAQPTGELIEGIQKQIKTIDEFTQTADFRNLQFHQEDGSESNLIIYIDDGRPTKLSYTNIVTSGKEEKTYYFNEQGLIYAEILQTTFQRTPRWEEAKSQELGETERKESVEKIGKNYFYFNNWKLIKWLPSPEPNSFVGKEMELVNEVRELLKMIN